MTKQKKLRSQTQITSDNDEAVLKPIKIILGEKIAVKSRVLASEADKVGPKNKTQDLITGRVAYIHPERRFFTVEYTFPKGTFMECFPMIRA